MNEDEGKFRESIWGIRPKWRLPFYIVLSIFGIGVFVFTLWKERYDESWLEIFDVLWERIFGSVVVVWFVFQIGETAVGAYKYFVELGKARLQEAEARLQEAEEKGRKEAQDQLRKWIEDGFRKQKIPEEQIQQILKLIDALEEKCKD